MSTFRYDTNESDEVHSSFPGSGAAEVSGRRTGPVLKPWMERILRGACVSPVQIETAGGCPGGVVGRGDGSQVGVRLFVP